MDGTDSRPCPFFLLKHSIPGTRAYNDTSSKFDIVHDSATQHKTNDTQGITLSYSASEAIVARIDCRNVV